MKNQLLAIFFYLIYLLALVKPVLPIVDYYVNYNYISKVLCENKNKPVMACNGKCYLQKQIAENNNLDFENNLLLPKINLKDFPTTTFQSFVYTFNELLSNCNRIFTQLHFYQYQYSTSLLKPPKISV